MVWVNIIGLFVLVISIAFKVNFLISYINKEKIKKLLCVLKKIHGWLIGVLLGFVAAVAIYKYALPGYYIQLSDLLLTLIVIAIIDVIGRCIPNEMVICLLISQIIAASTYSQVYLNILNVIFSGIVLVFLMIISRKTNEQIGMGDVKLIATINLIYGVSFMLYTMMFSLLLMLVFSLPLLVMRKIKLKSQLPFAPFYLLGVLAYVILSLL